MLPWGLQSVTHRPALGHHDCLSPGRNPSLACGIASTRTRPTSSKFSRGRVKERREISERSRKVRNQAAKGAKQRKGRPRGEAVPKSVQQRAAAPQSSANLPGPHPLPRPAPPGTPGAARGAAGHLPGILKGLRGKRAERRWVG